MKVLLIKNRYTKKLDIEKGIEWFKERTPIKVEVEEMITDFDLEFRKIGNDTYKGVVVSNYYDKLKAIVPKGKYHCVCLFYGNKAPGIRVSLAEDIPLYPDTDVIQVVTSDGGKTFNHELFHTFFKKLARRGIKLNDPMDVVVVNGVRKDYYNDKSLTAKHSNRTIALELLAPYWATIESFT